MVYRQEASKSVMNWVGFLGVRLAFGRCMGRRKANGALVEIHTSVSHGSAWSNSVLHPWGSEIVETDFESCFLMLCLVVWYLILCFAFFFFVFLLDPLADVFSISGMSIYLPRTLMLSKVAKSGQPRSRTQ